MPPLLPHPDDAHVSDLAVVFPGQGSQVPGFGQAWRDHPAWSVVADAEIATGLPLAHLLLDPAADLTRTADAQLAVLLGGLLVWEAAHPYLGRPAALAGHSLGQITALVAAGAVTVTGGLRLASARATATQAAADANPGGLVALLGASPQQAEEAVAGIAEAWVANDNAPGQVVIGGTPAGLEAATATARSLGVRKTKRLPVGGAFHTPLMASAATEVARVAGATQFSPIAVPVVTNHDATAHYSARAWPDHLSAHVVRPVRWRETVDSLVELGARRIVELGPGTTLSGLVRRCRDDVEVLSASTPEEVEGLMPALWGVTAR